jgi:glucokinase
MIAAYLDEVHEAIRQKGARIEGAGFGVAGPIIGKRVQPTNLGWDIDADALARQIGAPSVTLLNDLEATAYGVHWLASDQLSILNAGKRRVRASQSLIAAGTGLGEGVLHWVGDRYVAMPTEGGHCDLAPRTEQEIELLRYMSKSGGPVSFEMVLSGRGFLTLHRFLDRSMDHPDFGEPGVDPAPEITRRALEGSCPICVQALDLWVSLYGAEAGNLALKTLSLGGLFVAGGIAAKILRKLLDGKFLQAFCRKEKFAVLLSEIPIYVVLSEEAPLLGAAAEAARTAAV